ncbi:MAG: outer membrane protein assembly factor BamD [Planctomycetaceae bacterium]|jgi:outer membrane protein assembly factor BamD (BamD/ComL family)|nr:outer membrane protein assembly factor BamD [Planctomycetaceae bacterium]
MLRSLFFVLFLFTQTIVTAQSYNIAGGFYLAVREVDAPSGKTVIVTQFLHQGLINLVSKNIDSRVENAGKTVLVTTRSKKPVPFKILQLGPGDFCRLAIQTEEKTSSYNIYYGLPADKSPNNIQVPTWTNTDGLLMETRHPESHFNMDNFEAVKKAFEQSKKPIGADYVKNVHHGYNPFTFRREPFLTRYSGNLNVTVGGKYALLTSSHHCSFLLIDGKVAASHPGRHGRAGQARPELVKFITLTQGKHQFEYYHATGDGNASMLAVWELNPETPPKKLTLIPEEAFQNNNIVRVPAGTPGFANKPGSPDFVFQVVGSVPLPDNDQPIISVQFQNRSAGLAARGKLIWYFGDGQTSDEPSPNHIYLKPGIYSVELVSDTVSQHLSAVNRIEIDQPAIPADPKNPPTLNQYLTVLEKYDATKLDADSLLQLVEAYRTKIDSILNPTKQELLAAEKAMMEGTNKGNNSKTKPQTPQQQEVAKHEQVTKYRRLIAETVRSALADNPNFRGDSSIYKLALLAGGIARDYLLDWKLAGQIYVAAAQKLMFDDFAAECYALAAEVSLDMLNKTAAKKFIESAEKKVSKNGKNQSICTFYRVKGEYLAEMGQGTEAQQALIKANEVRDEGHFQYTEQVALQGSVSRIAETFLREKNYDRVIDAIRTWQHKYPAASYEGFISLLMAKYWIGREKYPQAAALADRQLSLNPNSPYIDELLLVAAEAQEKAGNKNAAQAYLHSLIKDYPGSPFVPDAKKQLKNLE